MTQQEKKQVNKQRMIEAAVHLFSKKNFSEVSIREIAKHANVSPALIYKYFDDQQHLYMETMKVEAQKLIERLSQHEELTELADHYIQFLFNEDVLYQMMAYFMLEVRRSRSPVPIHEETVKIMELFESALRPIFQDEAKRETQLLLSTLNGLLITYKNYPLLSRDEALDLIQTLTNRYIRHVQPNNYKNSTLLP